MASSMTVFDRWWPSTQSLDLIEGSMDVVADRVADHFRAVARYSGDDITTERSRFERLDAAFASVPEFVNVATTLLLLPTRSRWTVMWTNSFLCAGYDHFCEGLTRDEGLTTLHWSAHDATTTFQPGAMFHLRSRVDGALVERRVQAARTDRRWEFFETGEALPEEDVDGYLARRIRDRLDERRLMELLARLDARPWDEGWYTPPAEMIVRLQRPVPPAATRRRPADVVTGRR